MPSLILRQANKMLSLVSGLKVVWCKSWGYFFSFLIWRWILRVGKTCLLFKLFGARHLCQTHLVVGYLLLCVDAPSQSQNISPAEAGPWSPVSYSSHSVSYCTNIALRENWILGHYTIQSLTKIMLYLISQ